MKVKSNWSVFAGRVHDPAAKKISSLVGFLHPFCHIIGCRLWRASVASHSNSNTYFNLLLHVHHIIFQCSVLELTVYTCYHNEHQHTDFLILICLLVGLLKVSPGHARANMAAVTAKSCHDYCGHNNGTAKHWEILVPPIQSWLVHKMHINMNIKAH